MKNIKIILVLIIISAFTNCKKPTHTSEEEQKIDLKPTATLEYEIQSQLGEGAFWNHQTQELFWVDIEGKKLHIYNPSSKLNKTLVMPSRIGTVVPKDQDNAVVALEDGIYLVNTETSEITLFSDVESDKPYNRFNDGKCDPKGRFWVGSMSYDTKTKSAALYMLNPTGTIEKKQDSVTISNGIVWTKDKKIMYYIDTPLKNIRAFDYNNETGEISNERVAVVIADSLGFPDGMTIDENDNLWVGLWNGNGVGHFNPKSGKLIQKIQVPAQNVTSCAFGGKNLDTLFITTANLGMTEENIPLYPKAGSVFKYVPGVKGVKSSFFGNPFDEN